LNLWGNHIGDIGAKYLSEGLRNNAVSLIASPAVFYTNLLFYNQTLTVLNLKENRIGSIGAQDLARALRINMVNIIRFVLLLCIFTLIIGTDETRSIW
jgi:hypothetical protein